MHKNLKICFIGGGNMAAAMIGGMANKLLPGTNIHVVDINPETLASLQQRFGITTAERIDEAVAQSDVIVLAVKPQQMRDVVVELRPHVSNQLVLSIAAGICATDMSRWLNGHAAIVRTMPNTPALVGLGMSGMVAMDGVSPQQRKIADEIMKAVGTTVWLEDEAQIDAVTAVSGSGPAYVFYFLEAMQQAAQEMGLTAEQGKQLAYATFVGASQLAVQSAEPVTVLRERVTSKGGTTHAAINSMSESGVQQAIIRAMKAAQTRSQELSEEFGKE